MFDVFDVFEGRKELSGCIDDIEVIVWLIYETGRTEYSVSVRHISGSSLALHNTPYLGCRRSPDATLPALAGL